MEAYALEVRGSKRILEGSMYGAMNSDGRYGLLVGIPYSTVSSMFFVGVIFLLKLFRHLLPCMPCWCAF